MCYIGVAGYNQNIARNKLGGGITQAFESVRTVQRQALIGGLKCMYWLAKHEIAHSTNFESVLELASSLGCTYITELHQQFGIYKPDVQCFDHGYWLHLAQLRTAPSTKPSHRNA